MKTDANTRTQAIWRAAAVMGGLAPLALHLKLAERQLDYWTRGIGTPPDSVFFDLMEIIIERAGRRYDERAQPVYRTAA
jgi:hypothetical protein